MNLDEQSNTSTEACQGTQPSVESRATKTSALKKRFRPKNPEQERPPAHPDDDEDDICKKLSDEVTKLTIGLESHIDTIKNMQQMNKAFKVAAKSLFKSLRSRNAKFAARHGAAKIYCPPVQDPRLKPGQDRSFAERAQSSYDRDLQLVRSLRGSNVRSHSERKSLSLAKRLRGPRE